MRAQPALFYALLATGLAMPCDPATAAPAPEQGQDIVVTAQRRPEAAADVPISLTAVPGDALDRIQALSTPDLAKVVPSLVMMRTGPFTQPYLRGVGKRSTLGIENSVATYVDGVYFASSISALLDLRGVERVEVLNGPQGTLFGRNTSGGVIQIVTRDPSPGLDGEAEVEAGDYAYARGDLYLSAGNDRLAGNIAASLSGHDGYGTNLFSGRNDQGKVDHSLAARSKWVWRPNPSLKLAFAADYQDLDQDFPTRPAEGYPPLGQPRIQGFRDGDQDMPTRYLFRYGGLSAKAESGLGGATLTSLSAWRRMRAHYTVDLDLGPMPLVSADATAEQSQLSQEFQLQSPAGAALSWQAGLYFIRISERYDPTKFGYGGSYSARLGGRIGQSLFAKGIANSYAAYGQATVPIGEANRLTLGLRYTIEDRSVRAHGKQDFADPPFVRAIPGLPLPGLPPFEARKSFSEPTWHASVDRHFSDETMIYASASRGFQSGGWNLQTPQNPAFAPERLDDLEAGLKYRKSNGRVDASFTLFHYDYSDLQLTAVTPIGSATVNAAAAKAFGLEAQIDLRPDASTDLAFGLALQKTRFEHFSNASCVDYGPGAPLPYAPMACDASGNRLPFAPTLKLNLGASRAFRTGEDGRLTPSVNFAYDSGYFSEPDNVVRQGGFATLDASVEWRPGSHAPSFRLWLLNLTNAEYSDGLVTFPTTGVFQAPAPPRRIGLSLSYRL